MTPARECWHEASAHGRDRQGAAAAQPAGRVPPEPEPGPELPLPEPEPVPELPGPDPLPDPDPPPPDRDDPDGPQIVTPATITRGLLGRSR
jgi:hypothetical protein